MKYKSDAISILKNFIAYSSTQFQLNIKTVRCDNAKELTEGAILQYYFTQGIVLQKTCAATPQQNGIVERKHRHLLETTRALFFQSKLPISYWNECVLTATHLINRTPLKSINNISPYEKLYGKSPSLHHLRVFGCLCYVSTLKQNRSKFDPKADSCVFIGYPPNQKAYKVLNLNTFKVHITRDVTFHKKHFPFHFSQSPSTPSTSLFQIFLPSTTTNSSFFDHDVPDIFNNINKPTHNTQTTDITPISSPSDHSDPPSTSNNSSDSNIVDFSDTLHTTPSLTPDAPVLRRSQRHTTIPQHLDDFIYSLPGHSTNTSTHWCQLAFYTPSHSVLLAHLNIPKEPTCYKEAAKDPRWVAAMTKELQALAKNHTWDVVSLPTGKKPIACKWVYKTKLNADGTLERLKARLVAIGYTQKYGIDYSETFSPVVKMSTVRCILAIAASKGWSLYQLDVNNAFLHGDLHEEVYMKLPPGQPHLPDQVCKLRKSLYGLKQASRQWFSKLAHEFTHQGFFQSRNDYSLFIRKKTSGVIIAAVYVDDIVLTGTDQLGIHNLKHRLHHVFSIKDLGLLHYFLGFEVGYTPEGISLIQHKFTKEILTEANITTTKRTTTPLPLHLKLSAIEGPLFHNPTLYRSLVGKLNFLTNTRPDLAYSVQTLSQFLQAPKISHFSALQHVLHYVHNTSSQGILLKASDKLLLQAFSDSDWGACIDTRRSITGYILLLGNSPISWKSKKQSTISRSSAEAEYRAMSSAAAEVTWIVRLLEELGVDKLKPVTLHCDNQSALFIAKNPVFHERTKHIELDCHFTREKVLEGLLQLTYLPTRNQLADVLTKALPSAQFHTLLTKLGMFSTLPTLRGGVGHSESSQA